MTAFHSDNVYVFMYDGLVHIQQVNNKSTQKRMGVPLTSHSTRG